MLVHVRRFAHVVLMLVLVVPLALVSQSQTAHAETDPVVIRTPDGPSWAGMDLGAMGTYQHTKAGVFWYVAPNGDSRPVRGYPSVQVDPATGQTTATYGAISGPLAGPWDPGVAVSSEGVGSYPNETYILKVDGVAVLSGLPRGTGTVWLTKCLFVVQGFTPADNTNTIWLIDGCQKRVVSRHQVVTRKVHSFVFRVYTGGVATLATNSGGLVDRICRLSLTGAFGCESVDSTSWAKLSSGAVDFQAATATGHAVKLADGQLRVVEGTTLTMPAGHEAVRTTGSFMVVVNPERTRVLSVRPQGLVELNLAVPNPWPIQEFRVSHGRILFTTSESDKIWTSVHAAWMVPTTGGTPQRLSSAQPGIGTRLTGARSYRSVDGRLVGFDRQEQFALPADISSSGFALVGNVGPSGSYLSNEQVVRTVTGERLWMGRQAASQFGTRLHLDGRVIDLESRAEWSAAPLKTNWGTYAKVWGGRSANQVSTDHPECQVRDIATATVLLTVPASCVDFSGDVLLTSDNGLVTAHEVGGPGVKTFSPLHFKGNDSYKIDGNTVVAAAGGALHVTTLPFGGKMAPHLIGQLGPRDVLTGQSLTWSFDFSRAINAGRVIVRSSTGAVVGSAAFPAATDGAIRGLKWKAVSSVGVNLPAGVYAWTVDTTDVLGQKAVSVDGRGPATGTFSVTGTGTTSYPLSTNANDHTGDRLADSYAVDASGTLSLHRLNSTSAQRAEVYPTSLGVVTSITQIGDWNGDKRGDALIRRGDGSLWVYTSTASGDLRPHRQVGNNWATMDVIVYAGSLDGTTNRYLIARQRGTGDLYRYRITPTGLGNITKIGHGWNVVTNMFHAGDFNGDGRSDVIGVFSDGTMWLYRGRADGLLDTRLQIGQGWGTFKFAFSPGDINGDGRHDLVGVDAEGTLWSWLRQGAGWSGRHAMGHGYGQYSRMG